MFTFLNVHLHVQSGTRKLGQVSISVKNISFLILFQFPEAAATPISLAAAPAATTAASQDDDEDDEEDHAIISVFPDEEFPTLHELPQPETSQPASSGPKKAKM